MVTQWWGTDHQGLLKHKQVLVQKKKRKKKQSPWKTAKITAKDRASEIGAMGTRILSLFL